MDKQTVETTTNSLIEIGLGKQDNAVSIGFTRWTRTTKLQRNLLWRACGLDTQKVIARLQSETVQSILKAI